MKVIKWLVIIGLSLYIILCAGLYLNQEKLVFLPSPLSDHHQFRDGQEVFVEVEKDINLSCLYLEQADAKGVVLYLHGNKGNNRRCLKQAYQFELNDYSLFMPDYRGFGKSDGYPHSEAQMLKDIQKVYDYIQSELKPKKIIVVGYSLGTGMASYLAANNDVSELFLVAPFTSISDLKDEKNIPVPDFLVKFNFDTYSRLDKINCPITIFHSPIDEIIPYACSQKLKSQKTSIELYTLPSVSHRATIFNPMISDVFAKKLGRS